MSVMGKGSVLALTGAVATAGLVAAGSGAGAAPAASVRTPTIVVNGKTMAITGPTTFHAGRVRVVLGGGGGSVGIVHLKHGLPFSAYRASVKHISQEFGSNPKQALKDYRAALKLIVFHGGIQGSATWTKSMTTVLKPGTYYLYKDGNLPSHPHKLTVTKPAQRRGAPPRTGLVIMKPGNQFGGNKVLPNRGVITVRNNASNSPHFLILQHVKSGTTHKQIEDYLASGAQGAPSFALPESANTDTISQHMAQTLHYRMPKGEYVELCFFLDPQTGMPHAFMGMFRIVTLK